MVKKYSFEAIDKILSTVQPSDMCSFYQELKKDPGLIRSLFEETDGDVRAKIAEYLTKLATDCWTSEDIKGKKQVYYFDFENRSADLSGSFTGNEIKISCSYSFTISNPTDKEKEFFAQTTDVRYAPFSPVTLCYYNSTDKKCYEYTLPALYLYELAINQKENENSQIRKGNLDKLTLIFSGLGATSKFVLVRVATWAGMLSMVTDKVVNFDPIKTELLGSAAGKEFLDLWPNIYSTIIVADIATNVLSGFVESSGKIKSLFSKLSKEDAQIVESKVQQLTEELAKRTKLAKGADEIIASLSGTLKSTYEDLISAGLKSEVKANSILLKNAKNETVAIIYNNKITPTKWNWDYKAAQEGYTKTFTDEGYWLLKKGDDIKFDLGFKEGRKLEAKEVNDYLVNGQGKDLDGQPYWAGTQVDEIILGKKGETIYFIENYNGGAANPGQYASKDPISTIKELREKLAVKEAWKETAKEPTIRAYRVKADLKARSGIIGRQSDKGVELPGGGHQYEIIDYLGGNWKNYLEEISLKNGTKLK